MPARIRAIREDVSLRQEVNFDARQRALDALEFDVTGKAAPVIRELEQVNRVLFHRLREDIRGGANLRELIRAHVSVSTTAPGDGRGYDSLDVFLNEIFCAGPIPGESRTLESGMVYYQKTPGRIMLELIDRAGFTKTDVFYDLGSGLGQIPLLVHLLSGVIARGVEIEPAYVQYSERSAADLGITGVTFLNADAREADLSDGTVFFLYTPFTGRMLEEVLEKLRKLSERKPVRVFTYGPCTLEVSGATGWDSENPGPPDAFKLGAFRSV